MVYTGPERREFIRVQLFMPVKYSVADTQEEYIESQSEDISSGGMKLLLRKKFNVGTLLKLQFELLREEKIIRFDALQARIVWVMPNNNLEYPYKVGLEFINIDINERLRISNCIDHKAELLKKPFR
jgi:c-di-GMP-binding flagellar brake protein YcgR